MLNAAINRELDQKIKLISGLSNHKDIIRNDLKLACKVVDNMDKRWGLWNYSNVYEVNKKREEEELTKIDYTYKKAKNKAQKDATPANNTPTEDKSKSDEKKEDEDGAVNEEEKTETRAENGSSGDDEAKKNKERPTDESVKDQANAEEALAKNPLVVAAQRHLEHLSELSKKLKEKEKEEKEVTEKKDQENGEQKVQEKAENEESTKEEDVKLEDKNR